MNELEQKTQKSMGRNAFMRHNRIEMVAVEPDWAKFRLSVGPESLNPYGMVHGGALCTLADDTAGTAAHTDGRVYVTQTCSLNFLRNVPRGVIYATARVVHRGGATCLTSVEITAEDGQLMAAGELTYFCVDPKKLAQKASGK
jgi:uncharacterized domain 1